jgi:hypothetical protein
VGIEGGRAGGLTHYVGREPGVLNIFSKYSLKIPQIYSNILKYARIYLNILKYFPVGRARRSTERGRQVGT